MNSTVLQLVISAGIPSAVTGLLVWYIKRIIDKRDEEANRKTEERQKLIDEREAQRFKFEEIAFKKADASLELAIATAKAIQRIPDAKCNGDMHAALEKAERIRSESEDFFRNSMIKNSL